jgi:hypothetical protein
MAEASLPDVIRYDAALDTPKLRLAEVIVALCTLITIVDMNSGKVVSRHTLCDNQPSGNCQNCQAAHMNKHTGAMPHEQVNTHTRVRSLGRLKHHPCPATA